MNLLDKENLGMLMVCMLVAAVAILAVSALCVYFINKLKRSRMANSSPASGSDSSPDADRIVEKLRNERYGDFND